MRLLRGTPLLSAAVAVSIFTIGSLADSSSSAAALPQLSTATQQASTTAGNTNSKSAAAATNTASNTNSKTSASTQASTGETGITTTAVITGAGSAAATSGSVPVISITGGSSAAGTSDAGLTGLPTLSGAYKIVAPSVPPTSDAPFMQQSNLPEGTVFIAVGAILGFMAMSVLLWRGLVAWSLHRSVKRAALQQNMTDTKTLFSTPAAPFYKDYHDRDSTISLSGLGPKSGRKGGRPTTGGGAHPSQGSLFFSPTAAAGGLNTSGNRGSNYLPAGYYAAGAASPGNAQSHIPVGGHGPAISLSNLGPASAGYGRARSIGPSPPDSPSLLASRGHMASSSTVNLTHGYGGDQRAPSAYLEDLFDGEAGPPVPGQGHSRNPSGNTGSPRF
ncbi:hypothetical protein G7Y89_g8124 [Cudoniella acicularis]|uniref:CSI2 protein n=1 Tax=Cudoniella acicularis TaxID=354080 RepID=A0A8H4W1D4_9HELO|nr:hypothetical protein G7Y89_g8124 [Cudoniella acicularis]